MFETVLLFVGLLIVSSIFSGTETAFTSINEIKLLREKSYGSKVLRKMIKNKKNVIATILIGNNIVNTVLAVYAGAFFDDLMVETGILPERMGPLFASFVTVMFLLIFGEIVPKNIAVSLPRAWMKIVTFPLMLIVKALKPITAVMQVFSKIMLKILPFGKESDNSPTIQELIILSRISSKAGHIDDVEQILVEKAAKFNDLEARDVMIPRQQIIAVPDSIAFNDLKVEFRQHKFTRVPVYHEAVDKIIGIFNFKEMVLIPENQIADFNIMNHALIPLSVPESIPIGQLFEQMKQEKKHMAIIINEYGSTSGIVTIEDIIERMFGLIHDEYDIESHEKIRKINNTEYEIQGTLPLDDLETSLNIVIPQELDRQVNTISGLLTLLKGDFPQEKDEIIFKQLIFRVLKVKNMHVAKVLLIDNRKT